MFNFNPYLNFYRNPQRKGYNNIIPFQNNTFNNNNKNYNLNSNMQKNKHNTKNSPEGNSKETTRIEIGDFRITTRGIDAFGYHINFDDLIIILLIIFLFFDTDCDMSLIIILVLMLLNINLSTIKNLF